MARTAQVAEMINEGRHLVPPHMWSAVERYFLHGAPVGNFLTALLCNDLMEAIGRADEENVKALPDWARFLYNYAPQGSYGSPKAVEEWIATFAVAA